MRESAKRLVERRAPTRTRRGARSPPTPVQQLLEQGQGSTQVMRLVRLLGFTTLACGCVIGKYREVSTSREIAYVEEKGLSCRSHHHRRNQTVAAEPGARTATLSLPGRVA